MGAWVAFFVTMGIPRIHLHPHLESALGSREAASASRSGGPRVLVFGASSVVGEGLNRPGQERVGAVLAQLGTSSVEVWAKDAGMMTDILVMEAEALRTPADAVILYLTFNDAMNPSADSIGAALISKKGLGMMRAFYDSSSWMTSNFKLNGTRYEAQVSTFVSHAQQAGARVILVGEPSADSILYGGVDHGVTLYHRVLQDVANTRNAEYLDFPGLLMPIRDDILFVDQVHLNRHGHQLLAERLHAMLARDPR